MQITDIMNQYNRNLANGAEISSGTQGIKQIVSSLSEMAVGNVFEGSINHMENGTVTLGLPDGKVIQARLDAGVSVREGESMFFQVRSNNGAQIAIRPFSNGISTNPTLLHALEAANIQANGKMITMVNTMMEQSMSIDKQSLLHMAKLVMGNDNMDITSIVQMAKLGIPVTEEMAAQFENYKSDQYAILDQLESVMEMLPEKLAGGSLNPKELLDFNQQMIKIFLGSEEMPDVKPSVEQPVDLSEGVPQQTADGKVIISNESELPQGTEVTKQAAAGVPEITVPVTDADGKEAVLQKDISVSDIKIEPFMPEVQAAEQPEVTDGKHILAEGKMEGKEGVPQVQAQAQEAVLDSEVQNPLQTAESLASSPDRIKNLLSDSLFGQLSKQLAQIPELSKHPILFSDGKLSPEVTSRELLSLLEQTFSSSNPFTRQALGSLVSSKAYRTLVRNVMEQQWLLKPEELKTEHKVEELYERLDRQLNQMEKVLKEFGQNTQQLTNTAANVRENIQFMNQINQTYAYVQIPLKLAGQNAHSDLYVYTDKRKARQKDGELTAFLHLDLEHLGSTDVSIKMHQKKVATNFYLKDDVSYQLLLEHLDELEQRLMEKGYHAKIHVENQEEKVNFVEDLLKQGAPSAGGMVHRYSFDVRA